MRRLDENKIKQLKKSGKQVTGAKGDPIGKDVAIPGVRRKKKVKDQKPGTKEPKPAASPQGAEAVKSLAQSIDLVAKRSEEIVKTTAKMVGNVMVKLEKIKTDPVDVKVEVQHPDPGKKKLKKLRCENIERDQFGYIKSFEIKEIQ